MKDRKMNNDKEKWSIGEKIVIAILVGIIAAGVIIITLFIIEAITSRSEVKTAEDWCLLDVKNYYVDGEIFAYEIKELHEAFGDEDITEDYYSCEIVIWAYDEFAVIRKDYYLCAVGYYWRHVDQWVLLFDHATGGDTPLAREQILWIDCDCYHIERVEAL